MNDLYSFEPAQRTWNLLVPNGGFLPAARWFHGFSEAKGKLFVFGGMGHSGTLKRRAKFYFGLFFVLTFNTYIFFGKSEQYTVWCSIGLLNDLHMYDLSTSMWVDLSRNVSGASPSPRQLHGFTSCSDNLYVFGGWDGEGREYISDTLAVGIYVKLLFISS